MRIVLVRHAAVTVEPDVPSRNWHLSPEGRVAAEALAGDARFDGIETLYVSPEPKAIGTAQRIAAARSMRFLIEPDLHEVERPWAGEGGYRALAERFLRGETIDGWESRSDAQGRMRGFADGLGRGRDVAIVSHGLALTLLLADVLPLDPDSAVSMWSALQFPDAALLDWPAGRFEGWFGQGTNLAHSGTGAS